MIFHRFVFILSRFVQTPRASRLPTTWRVLLLLHLPAQSITPLPLFFLILYVVCGKIFIQVTKGKPCILVYPILPLCYRVGCNGLVVLWLSSGKCFSTRSVVRVLLFRKIQHLQKFYFPCCFIGFAVCNAAACTRYLYIILPDSRGEAASTVDCVPRSSKQRNGNDFHIIACGCLKEAKTGFFYYAIIQTRNAKMNFAAS